MSSLSLVLRTISLIKESDREVDGLEQKVRDASGIYKSFLNNPNKEKMRKLFEVDSKLAELLEEKHHRDDQEVLEVEVISGNKLKGNILSDNYETASTYSQVRYIINSEMAKPKDNVDQVLGNFYLDFNESSKWFLLYENGLIVSVLCYLGSRSPTNSSQPDDNLQSFSTRSSNKFAYGSKGYNQMLMKYASQFIESSDNCKFLKLGIEHYNIRLIELYRKVGFELMPEFSKRLWDEFDKSNIFMKYICSPYDTIKFKLPRENGGRMVIEDFGITGLIEWEESRSGDGTFKPVKGVKRFNRSLSDVLCGNYKDKTRSGGYGRCREEASSVRRTILSNQSKFDMLTDEKKLNLYNEAKNMATIRQYNGDLRLEGINIDRSKPDSPYRIPITMTEGYKSGYYMTELEYNTNDVEIKKLVAKRYFIIKETLNNQDLKLQEGIQEWRDAFYDLRFIFLRNLRKLVKEKLTESGLRELVRRIGDFDNQTQNFIRELQNLYTNRQELTEGVFNRELNERLSVLTLLESYLYDCSHPHCYFKVDQLWDINNPNKELYFDFLRDATVSNYISKLDNIGPFFSGYLFRPQSGYCDPYGLGYSNFVSGIPLIYLISWDYESFLGMMGHEVMHLALAGGIPLLEILFEGYYNWINKLSRYSSEYNKAEKCADLLSFHNVAKLLEHSSLTWEEQLDVLRKVVPGICGTPPDEHHPPGNYRIDLLIAIPHIYKIMVKNGLAED